jgi:hypothetical protein
MADREDLFVKFGPLLLEAFIVMSVEETNRLRTQLGMPLVTKQMFLDEINAQLSDLVPYDWMLLFS